MSRNYIFDFFKQKPQAGAAIQKLLEMFPDTEEVTPETVYKQGSAEARALIDIAMKEVIAPGSKIIDPENFTELYKLSQAGHSCLLLVEHYSNFDLSNLCYLTDNHPLIGKDFSEKLIAMAGVKLSVENSFVAAYSRAYNRIVIYPSRGLDSITNENEKEKMRKLILPYNMASMKELTTRKYHKQMVLVFPSGTRIRPWDEETKKGVKEMASYAKAFEYLCFVSLNGNNLPIDQNDKDMTQDRPQSDIIMIAPEKPVKSADFLAECNKTLPEGGDSKAHIVKCIMDRLFKRHEEIEVIRQQAINNQK